MAPLPIFETNLPGLDAQLDVLRREDLVRRIWDRDHTVWNPHPAEISNRLDWLTVTTVMRGQLPLLEGFARSVREAGFRHVVLLGMGGSSLGPEVLRQTFGSAPEHPELIVLDSTFPDSVRAVTQAIEPARTLFLVSSKSGSTIEPNTFYAHFREQVTQAVGTQRAGGHFAAITDQDTGLARMAARTGFRRAFLNPPDIGGRYSVLSYFGLVPAALIGVDLALLLDRADDMAEACRPGGPVADNPGAWLGACLAAGWTEGRDKLSLKTPPPVAAFGLWVEQLLAESLGKAGKGIIPVVGESPDSPASGGSDRLAVRMSVGEDMEPAPDASDGGQPIGGQPIVHQPIVHQPTIHQPTIQLKLADRYDLGGDFFRWEFATAVAGALIGVHPFDQPDVQSAKDRTDRVLENRETAAGSPVSGTVADLLAQAGSGDYLAILVYGRETPKLNGGLGRLRALVTKRWGIPATVGYGPRYLHSTGQLHKGGPNSGLYLLLTVEPEQDLAIPGYGFSFGTLNQAQWMGDFQALQEAGRRAARLDLGQDPTVAVREMMDGLGGSGERWGIHPPNPLSQGSPFGGPV